MPRLTIISPATAYTGHGRRRRVVTNVDSLRSISGINSNGQDAEFELDDELIDALGLTGGIIRFTFDERTQEFLVMMVFGVYRQPNKDELRSIAEETKRQLQNGLGVTAFSFLDQICFSTQLADASLNDSPTDEIPEFSVCAWPDNRDSGLRFRYSEKGTVNALLIQDLRRAADKGHPTAQLERGMMYLEGKAVPVNKKLGRELIDASVAQNYELAILALASALLGGDLLEKSLAEGEALLRGAVDDGSVMALGLLGEQYTNEDDFPGMGAEGIQMLTEASEQGLEAATAELGNCFEFGLGTAKDLKKAVILYERALDDGLEMVKTAFHRVSDQLTIGDGLFGTIHRMVSSVDEFELPFLGEEDDKLVLVPSDDPEMAEAVRIAQAHLFQFIIFFENAKPGDKASVKVRLEEDDTVEFVWMTVTKFTRDCFEGIIDNTPELVTTHQMGDTFKAHANYVNDWLFVREDDSVEGGFTVELLKDREKGSKKS